MLCISAREERYVKTRVIRLRVIEVPNVHDHVLCIPFILSGGPNECWLHTCDACVITTWKLGLRTPLVAPKYENLYIRMTQTTFYEPARLSTPPKPLFSLKPLDAKTWLRSLLSKVFLQKHLDLQTMDKNIYSDTETFAWLMFELGGEDRLENPFPLALFNSLRKQPTFHDATTHWFYREVTSEK